MNCDQKNDINNLKKIVNTQIRIYGNFPMFVDKIRNRLVVDQIRHVTNFDVEKLNGEVYSDLS